MKFDKTGLIILLLIAQLLSISCFKPENKSFNALLKSQIYTVIMFFAPDCPLCMTYSKPFNDLAEQYPDMRFIAVHSGRHYEAMDLQMFAREMQLKAEIFMDYDYSVARQFGATTTPEFVLVNEEGSVLYQGQLDDRMASLGVYKQHWDQHYLKEAIEAARAGNTIAIRKTEAIGCVLEY